MPAFGPVMEGERRLGIGAGDMAEEFLVLIWRDIGLGPASRWRDAALIWRVVSAADRKHDRMRDMVGIGAHHLLDLPVFEEFLRVILEVEHDARAARPAPASAATGSTVKVPLPSDDHR